MAWQSSLAERLNLWRSLWLSLAGKAIADRNKTALSNLAKRDEMHHHASQGGQSQKPEKPKPAAKG